MRREAPQRRGAGRESTGKAEEAEKRFMCQCGPWVVCEALKDFPKSQGDGTAGAEKHAAQHEVGEDLGKVDVRAAALAARLASDLAEQGM